MESTGNDHKAEATMGWRHVPGSSHASRIGGEVTMVVVVGVATVVEVATVVMGIEVPGRVVVGTSVVGAGVVGAGSVVDEDGPAVVEEDAGDGGSADEPHDAVSTTITAVATIDLSPAGRLFIDVYPSPSIDRGGS